MGSSCEKEAAVRLPTPVSPQHHEGSGALGRFYGQRAAVVNPSPRDISGGAQLSEVSTSLSYILIDPYLDTVFSSHMNKSDG